jgi:4-diphosphocytidyl-2-C-methyl-D-erythritol kinase
LKLVVRCPAKINTYLQVGAKDRRGYHPLRTEFQAIDLCDVLTVDTGGTPGITCNWPDLPLDNTLTKTLRLIGEIANFPPLAIHLEKTIPSQAGLGGGSSDAAGLIRAIDRIVQGKIPEAELRAVAVAVGADVPFFLVGGRALGLGYGERLTPLEDLPTQRLVVAMPFGVTCSTPEMFGRLDAMGRETDLSESLEPRNDFELVAPEACLAVAERLRALGATRSGLTGSGAAVFGVFLSEADARHASAEIGANSLVARTLGRSESLRIERE